MPKPAKGPTEVVPAPQNDRRQRRKFTAEQKLRILREADQCATRGEIGELLRREGIYSSHLSLWRAQRDRLGVAGLDGQRRGPTPKRNDKNKLIERLEREKVRIPPHSITRSARIRSSFRRSDQDRSEATSNGGGQVAGRASGWGFRPFWRRTEPLPSSRTPQMARECAGSVPWHHQRSSVGRGASSPRSSRQTSSACARAKALLRSLGAWT